MPSPTAKDNWLAQFEARLHQLRPNIGSKFSTIIANNQWHEQSGVDPRVAADRWVAQSAGSTK